MNIRPYRYPRRTKPKKKKKEKVCYNFKTRRTRSSSYRLTIIHWIVVRALFTTGQGNAGSIKDARLKAEIAEERSAGHVENASYLSKLVHT